MRLMVSRALSGLRGGGAGSDGAVRTSSLRRSCDAQWAERLQVCRKRGEQEPRFRRMAHPIPSLADPGSSPDRERCSRVGARSVNGLSQGKTNQTHATILRFVSERLHNVSFR
ncbi:hypothetical protein GCM10008965_30280 [Methylorubrum aminovorans]|nr:hypothetical protein GCM10025880_50320 [Methylorubrum aminovorans]